MASREHHVLQIPELLELILAQLPMRDLLLAQRVCWRFNTVIRTSIPLQQTLFFRPRPASGTPEPATPSSSPASPPPPRLPLGLPPLPGLHPLPGPYPLPGLYSLPGLPPLPGVQPMPESLPPPPLPSGSPATENHPPDQTPTFPKSLEPNPLLVAAFPPWFGLSISERKPTTRHFNWTQFRDLPLDKRLNAFTRPEASWRRMQVTQPPVVHVDMCRMTTYPRMANADVAQMDFSKAVGGLTMGAYYDLTCQLVLPPECGDFRARLLDERGAERISILTLRCVSSPYFSGAYEEVGLEWKP